MVGPREARVRIVHDGRRNAGEAERTRRADRIAREWMRRVRLPVAFTRISHVDKHAAVLDLHGEAGHAVVLETGFTQTRAVMEFPSVPRTLDIAGRVDAALTERSADMVAHVRYRTERTVLKGDRKRSILDLHRPAGIFGEFLGGADVNPVWVASHGRTSSIRFAWNGDRRTCARRQRPRIDLDQAVLDPNPVGRQFFRKRRRRATIL